MFYLMTHATHYSTHFYLRLYGIGRMVKDHADSERNLLLPLCGYSIQLALIAARVLLYAQPTDRTTHTTVFVTPVMEHWLEQEIAQWDRSDDPCDDPSHHREHSYHRAISHSQRLGSHFCITHGKYHYTHKQLKHLLVKCY